ncbi:hypothetical protein Lalb_Chr11g0066311 [Lupinus albus]|uniref:Uncharacterized protein n=1 Tax=Lupinus albus TaxID=3870 RepID=A0A6A4PRE0_LUPAL|nr:hypothetical protein Lalb_Chr11g0066311 [Lupinus albus]
MLFFGIQKSVYSVPTFEYSRLYETDFLTFCNLAHTSRFIVYLLSSFHFFL